MRAELRSARRCRALAGLAVVTLAVAACVPGGQDGAAEETPPYEPEPVQIDEAAPQAEQGRLRLPRQLQGLGLRDPGWDSPPRTADGVFLAPGETDGVLTFSAVDASGTILWQAERPVSCTGFTITSTGDRSLAVLTDRADGEGFGATTATAYDLLSGEKVWGPVEVPGPHQGPGTVFAPPPEGAMGESGPGVVLDPSTGEVLVDERGDAAPRIVGEYRGTVLTAEDGRLQARRAAESGTLWNVELSELGWGAGTVDGRRSATPDAQTAALIGVASDDAALIDLDSGDVIADDLRDAAEDPTSGTWITLGEDLAGYDSSGRRLFTHADASGLEIAGIGGVLVYLRSDQDRLQIHNVTTGAVGSAYDAEEEGTTAVPRHISVRGTGVVRSTYGYLLAPSDQSGGSPGG